MHAQLRIRAEFLFQPFRQASQFLEADMSQPILACDMLDFVPSKLTIS